MARALLPLALLAGCASVPQAPECDMAEQDRAWLGSALLHWQKAESQWLELEPAPLPQIVAVDAACVYTMPQGRVEASSARPHDGETVVLGEMRLPLGPIAFADGSGRFVMSLPSVWRMAGITSQVDFDIFLQGVMLHEIMHTRQAALASAALEEVEMAYPGRRISDDLVQETFGADPAYVALYETETALLFAAAEAPDDASARQLAAQALAAMQDRRHTYFRGDLAYLAEVEDVFLTMEGMGQYLLHRHLVSQPQISAELAWQETLRGGYWTQNQGFALILVLDRLLPDWTARAFRQPDWRAANLLQAAAALPAE